MSLSASSGDLLRNLTGELENFERIAQYLLPKPGDLPRLTGIDIFGGDILVAAVMEKIGADDYRVTVFADARTRNARVVWTHQPERALIQATRR